MSFERFFRLVSYAAVFCGFFSLWISGTFGAIITVGFAVVFVGAWLLEDRRWQIGERLGTALIVLALPVFYGLWYSNFLAPASSQTPWIAGLLARMILCLTAIKLLQRKSDRDWIFLYLMAFFQVLLAAGLSISGLYLVSFLLYLLLMVSAIISFEIRKTARDVDRKIAGTVVDKRRVISESTMIFRARRVPSVSIALIIFIAAVAVPTFFLLPRVGGAGLGADQRALSMTGFTERVTLGKFGSITENDNIVMRVKYDDAAAVTNDLYFRGVALDSFDNKTWSRSKVDSTLPLPKGAGDSIEVNSSNNRGSLLTQTIYLEALDAPILFALPTAVEIVGNFDSLNVDAYGAIRHSRGAEMIRYKVRSDRSVPGSDKLRADNLPYSADVLNYRSLPSAYDLRIADLAASITANSKNRYDKALAIESYLQTNFGYTLEQKAGGNQPLADFLFRVREGHCEYFASAMAIMLRTQGIATRVVNGFHGGEYNDTAGMTVVRQRHAHAWVEVYFPGEDYWMKFDPTPFSGQPGGVAAAGISGTFGKYIEALEGIWIQYFVAFDDQGQRSLGRSVRDGFMDYQARIAAYVGATSGLAAEWLRDVRGDKGLRASVAAILYAAGALLGSILGVFVGVWLIKKFVRLGFWKRLIQKLFSKRDGSIVEFYENLIAILAKKGFTRQPFQTPLEFAYSVDIPEAVTITEKYQQVRFGRHELSGDESSEVRRLLDNLQKKGDVWATPAIYRRRNLPSFCRPLLKLLEPLP